jgi:hypothetical protein
MSIMSLMLQLQSLLIDILLQFTGDARKEPPSKHSGRQFELITCIYLAAKGYNQVFTVWVAGMEIRTKWGEVS